MKNLSKAVVLFIFTLAFFGYFIPHAFTEEWSYPSEISGKILDQNGNLFTGEVTVLISAKTILLDKNIGTNESSKWTEYKQDVTGGIFSWKGNAISISIQAKKDGYHSSMVNVLPPPGYAGREIKRNDILIYMIPKGNPSTLEYTKGAEINNKDNKPYGWSFKKRWHFPVDEEESVWMTLSFNEKEEAVYTMKEPGGFVLFPGYPRFESKPDELGASLDWMTQAPESGYVQTIIPEEDKIKNKTLFSPCYYFRTPEGKYGKIIFPRGTFTYYLQPDGSRNLEAGEIIKKYPVNPIEANRHKGN